MTDFKMVPMYVGKCPRCGEPQENLRKIWVDIVCENCYHKEHENYKIEFTNKLKELNDIKTSLEPKDVEFAENNTAAELSMDADSIIIHGASGVNYEITARCYQLYIKVL